MLQSLLLVGLGGFLTIAGTVTGQYLQSRNVRRLRLDEYAREDRYRLFRDRLQAYHEYHVAAGHARSAMAVYNASENGVDLDKKLTKARSQVWRAYTLVWLIGEERVSERAKVLLDMVDDVARRGVEFQPDSWAEAIRAFVTAARSDLSRHSDS
jgi:hypothetical protein